MALTVEDGTIVTGADSYGTVAGLRTYAAARGATVPAADAACEVLMIKAMDVLENEFKGMYQGLKVNNVQGLNWPRSGVVVDGYEVSYTSIPTNLINAQYAFAIEANLTDLMPNDDRKGAVISEKVEGAVEVHYSDRGKSLSTKAFAKPTAILRPLLKTNSLWLKRA